MILYCLLFKVVLCKYSANLCESYLSEDMSADFLNYGNLKSFPTEWMSIKEYFPILAANTFSLDDSWKLKLEVLGESGTTICVYLITKNFKTGISSAFIPCNDLYYPVSVNYLKTNSTMSNTYLFLLTEGSTKLSVILVGENDQIDIYFPETPKLIKAVSGERVELRWVHMNVNNSCIYSTCPINYFRLSVYDTVHINPLGGYMDTVSMRITINNCMIGNFSTPTNNFLRYAKWQNLLIIFDYKTYSEQSLDVRVGPINVGTILQQAGLEIYCKGWDEATVEIIGALASVNCNPDLPRDHIYTTILKDRKVYPIV